MVEHTEPEDSSVDDEQLVVALDLASEPFATVRKATEEAGFDIKVIQRLMDRLKARYQPVLSEMTTVKTAELTKMLEDRAYRALSYLDDYALAGASGKDLAIIAGIMLEKRQLLRGEPTHILSTTERQNMSELVPLLVREATRRGLTVQNEMEMVDVTPPGPEREVRSRARLTITDKMRKARVNAKIESGEP